MSWKRNVSMFVLGALIVPVMAQAPGAISIVVNGVAMQGKALNYKGRLYVPLEDVAKATGGSYHLDSGTGIVTATIPTTPNQAVRPNEFTRPHLKVTYERKYTTLSNARVIATISNNGEQVARNVEVFCIFKGGANRELSTAVQNAGDLSPGERRTLEFRLFEAANVASPYDQGIATGQIPEDRVLINGEWTRVSYELRFQYQ